MRSMIDTCIEINGDTCHIRSDVASHPEKTQAFRRDYWRSFQRTKAFSDMPEEVVGRIAWLAADIITRLTSGEDVTVTPDTILEEIGLSGDDLSAFASSKSETRA